MNRPEHCSEVEPDWWLSEVSCPGSGKAFYEGRIRFILEQHNFEQREQLLGCVLSAAMGDRSLSLSDLLSVISQVEEAHQKSMEANYNEMWKN